MDLSIVTTLYNSAPYLEEFCARARKAAQKITSRYEIVLVNDGSPDTSLDLALAQQAADSSHIRVIDLARNFGHHKAMMTGLIHSRGELVLLIDSDLEEEPELLSDFHQTMLKSHADVVYGIQDKRKGRVFERITGNLFYSIFNFLSTYPVPANLVTMRLMQRRYVDSLIEHQDREVFMAGLWAITGFTQVPHLITKGCRGSTNYGISRKISILVNSITSFSNKPLSLIFYLGCIIILIATAAASYLLARKIFFGVAVSGWTSLILSVWLLGGITTFCLGVIGIYVSKIFSETKRRPYTIIKHIYQASHDHKNISDKH